MVQADPVGEEFLLPSQGWRLHTSHASGIKILYMDTTHGGGAGEAGVTRDGGKNKNCRQALFAGQSEAEGLFYR